MEVHSERSHQNYYPIQRRFAAPRVRACCGNHRRWGNWVGYSRPDGATRRAICSLRIRRGRRQQRSFLGPRPALLSLALQHRSSCSRTVESQRLADADLEALPTGQELIDQFLEPLANLPELRSRIYFGARVISVGRKGLDKVVTQNRDTLPFELKVEMGGKIEFFEARL